MIEVLNKKNIWRRFQIFGFTKKTFNKSMAELEAAGLIKRERCPNGDVIVHFVDYEELKDRYPIE